MLFLPPTQCRWTGDDVVAAARRGVTIVNKSRCVILTVGGHGKVKTGSWEPRTWHMTNDKWGGGLPVVSMLSGLAVQIIDHGRTTRRSSKGLPILVLPPVCVFGKERGVVGDGGRRRHSLVGRVFLHRWQVFTLSKSFYFYFFCEVVHLFYFWFVFV